MNIFLVTSSPRIVTCVLKCSITAMKIGCEEKLERLKPTFISEIAVTQHSIQCANPIKSMSGRADRSG